MVTTPLRHVYLSNDAETVSWRGDTLCLLCYEQFGLPQVIEEGDPEHHAIYHVVLPGVLRAHADLAAAYPVTLDEAVAKLEEASRPFTGGLIQAPASYVVDEHGIHLRGKLPINPEDCS